MAFFYPPPIARDPLLDRGFITLDRATFRLLARRTQRCNQLPDVVGMITNAVTTLDHCRDARARPKVRRIAMRLRAFQKLFDQQLASIGREFGLGTGTRVGRQTRLTSGFKRLTPPRHTPGPRSDHPRRFNAGMTFMHQRHRPASPTLQLLRTSMNCHVHINRPSSTDYLNHAGVNSLLFREFMGLDQRQYHCLK